MAMERTHVELEAINATHPRLARFCSTLVLAWPDDHEEVFEGTVEGTLVWPVRGVLGHGYDPMFQPIGHNRTFAEMTPDEKNSISHRADSFKKLIAGCFG
jgi:XTP/dITP diphosphohydrolase